MASLIDVLDESDYGLFILAPDDVSNIRDISKKIVRDNIIFELGLFIGRLGSDRCFLLVPRDVEDLHLPTDLLGITPAVFDPDRQDCNMVAALGPACNRIRKSVAKLGKLHKAPVSLEENVSISGATSADDLTSDPDDCIALIQSWMGGRPASENLHAIKYDYVDRELRLSLGSARKFIEIAAKRWDYVAERKGKDLILFRQETTRFNKSGDFDWFR